VHVRTRAALQKQFGAGTPAFKKAWDDADNWITDDINAYGVENRSTTRSAPSSRSRRGRSEHTVDRGAGGQRSNGFDGHHRLRRWLVTLDPLTVHDGEPPDGGQLTQLVHNPSGDFVDPEIVGRTYRPTLADRLDQPDTGQFTVERLDSDAS
jgi:hypothetical protein